MRWPSSSAWGLYIRAQKNAGEHTKMLKAFAREVETFNRLNERRKPMHRAASACVEVVMEYVLRLAGAFGYPYPQHRRVRGATLTATLHRPWFRCGPATTFPVVACGRRAEILYLIAKASDLTLTDSARCPIHVANAAQIRLHR